MSITVERLVAEVDAQTNKAVRELEAFKAKAEKTIKSIDAEAKIKLVPDSRGLNQKIKAQLKTVDGTVKINVKPDFTGFKEKIRAYGATIPAIKVRVEADTATTSQLKELMHNKSMGFGEFGDIGHEAVDNVAQKVLPKPQGTEAFFARPKSDNDNIKQAANDLHNLSNKADKATVTLKRAAQALAIVGIAGLSIKALTKYLGPGELIAEGFAMAIASIVPALQAVSGAAIGLGSALAQLPGLVALLPAALVGIGTAAGAVAVSVMGVGEAIKFQQQQIKDASKAADEHKNAVTALADAEHNLKNAQIASKDAQKNLIEARRDAANNLEDLRLASRSAALSEEGAVLSLRRAQENLRRINKELGRDTKESTKVTDEFSGRIYEIANASNDASQKEMDRQEAILAVKEAELSLVNVRKDRRRTERDLAEAERKGIDQADAVVAANRSVEDSLWSLNKAQESYTDAVKKMAEANKYGSSTGKQLAKAMKDLAPAAQEFVTKTKGMKKEFDEFRKTIQQQFFLQINKGVGAAGTLMTRLSGPLAQISGTIGDIAQGLVTKLAEGRWAGILDRLLSDNAKMWGTVKDAVYNVVDGVLNIADAARPMARWFNDHLTKWAEDFGRWASHTDKLHDFFKSLMTTTDKLGGGLWDLVRGLGDFLRLASPLRTVVLDSFVEIGKSFRAFTEGAGKNQLKQVFADLIPIMKMMGGVFHTVWSFIGKALVMLLPLGERIAKSLGPVLTTLSDELLRVMKPLIPVLGDVVEAIGDGLVGAFKVIGPVLAQLVKDAGPALVAVIVAIKDALLPGDQMAAIFLALGDALTKLIQGGALDAIVVLINTMADVGVDLIRTVLPPLVYLLIELANTIQMMAEKGWLDDIIKGIIAFSAINAVLPIFTTLTGAIKGLGMIVGIIASPVGLAVAAIVALGIAFYVAYKKVDWFHDGVDKIWQFIKRNFAPTVENLKKHWKEVGVTIASVGAILAVFLNPVGLVIAAIGVLIAVFVKLYQRNEHFRKAVAGVVDWFKSVAAPKIKEFALFIGEQFGNLVQWVREHWGEIKEAISHILNVVGMIIDKFISAVQWWWRTFGDDITRIWKGVWNGVHSFIQIVVDLIKGVIETFLAVINGDWGKAWDTVVKTFKSVWMRMLGILKGFKEIFLGVLGGIWDAASTGVKNAFGTVKDAVFSVVAAIIDAYNQIPFLPDVKIPEWLRPSKDDKGKSFMGDAANKALTSNASNTAWGARYTGQAQSAGVGQTAANNAWGNRYQGQSDTVRRPPASITYITHEGMSGESMAGLVDHMKKVEINQTFNERVDPKVMVAELGWELQKA